MPTNLPEKSKAIWAKAIAEKNPERKLELLREFYSSFPKHKSTEKLEVAIKKQISSLEEKIERAKKKKTGSTQKWSVKKEEIQIAVLGSPDSLSNFSASYLSRHFSRYEILDKPCVSVITSNGSSLQSVLIPYSSEMSEQKQRILSSIARNADCLLLLGCNREIEEIVEWLEDNNIHVSSRESLVSLELEPSGGLRIVSRKEIEKGARDLLIGYGIRNAVVFIGNNATLDDLEAAIFQKIFKRCLSLSRELPSHLKIEPVDSSSKDALFTNIIRSLGYIRVYTKDPSEGIAKKPILIKEGATAIDLAREIHKDLASDFTYARIWRRSEYSGERIGKDFKLRDMDILEIHTHSL
jgi:ribosome-interacting GTPase 1